MLDWRRRPERIRPLRTFPFVLLLSAQLMGCADPCFLLSREEQPRVVSIPVSGTVEAVSPLSIETDEFIVVARPSREPLAIELTRVGSEGVATVATTPPLFPYHTGSIVVREGAWWFSRQGDRERRSDAYFVIGGATVQEHRVKLSPGFHFVWLPLTGHEPKGLLVSLADEQPALRVHEVTPSGVRSLASFPWWQTGLQQAVQTPHPARWSAEPLGDGRSAIVAVDGPAGEAPLILRIIGGESPSEFVIPCAPAIDLPLSTANDPSGRLAIVGRSRRGEVVASLVNLDQPESAQCTVISEPGEIASAAPFGPPSVVATKRGFVAAWIREDGTVRAADLGALPRRPFVLEIGKEADVDRPYRELAFGQGEHVTFVWKRRDGTTAVRRLPESLSAIAFASELCRLIFPGDE